MWNRFLPRQFDQSYDGYKPALWIFGFVLLMKTGMGFNSVFNGYKVATLADGVPLQTFGATATQAVLYLFAAWGFNQLLLSALGVLALVRYRSMVPLMFTVQFVELLGRKVFFGRSLTLPRAGSPPGVWVNLVLIGVMAVGVLLSLLRPSSASRQVIGEPS